MKINYFPAGGRDFASSRLRVWKIADALKTMGHSVMVCSYNSNDCDVVVFQKTWQYTAAMRMFRAKGKRIIFDVDDLISTPIPAEVDLVTVDTPFKLADFPGAVVVPDCLDVEDGSPIKADHAPRLSSLVWVGNAENMKHLSNVAQACERLKLDLTAITDLGSAHYAHYPSVQGLAWSLDSVDSEMIRHDLFVAPYILGGADDRWVRSKSANRLWKARALGLPVAGTGIPSYREAGLTWEAETVEEWIEILIAAGDQMMRCYDAARGMNAADQFCAERVALQWLKVFEGN